MAPIKRSDGVFVREDADDVDSSLDFAAQAFEPVGRVQLDAVRRGKAHLGKHVVLGLVHEGCERGRLGPELVDNQTLSAVGQGGVQTVGGTITIRQVRLTAVDLLP